jgi:hypothetical protein
MTHFSPVSKAMYVPGCQTMPFISYVYICLHTLSADLLTRCVSISGCVRGCHTEDNRWNGENDNPTETKTRTVSIQMRTRVDLLCEV